MSRTPATTPSTAADAAHTGGLLAIATVVLTLLGWASIPLFLRHFAQRDIDAWTSNGWRYAFSALLWAPMLWVGARNGTLTRRLWRAALLPSLFNALGQIAFALAPFYVEPGVMTFSLRLQIVFVTIGAAVLFAAERRVIRTPGFLAGLLLVTIGTAGTIWLKEGGLGKATGFGVFLSIGSGLLYACYALAVRHSMRGVNPLLAFAVISQLTAAALLPLMLIWGKGSGLALLDQPPREIFLVLLSSLIGIGLGHTFYYFSIARLGVAVSAGVIQLQPILVAIVSIRMFGEVFTRDQWIAGGIAVVGAGAILWAQHRATRRRGPVREFSELPVDVDAAAAVAERTDMNASRQREPAPTPRA
jgi:drug/metabolite transporter (DMT)-like permease